MTDTTRPEAVVTATAAITQRVRQMLEDGTDQDVLADALMIAFMATFPGSKREKAEVLDRTAQGIFAELAGEKVASTLN